MTTKLLSELNGLLEQIDNLRPTTEQVINLPEVILESSKKYFSTDLLWQSEEALFSEILNDGNVRTASNLPEVLWFFVRSDWDVFANIGTLEDWWCLGNLKRDSVETIIHRFENDETPGLKSLFSESPAELTKQYGNPNGHRVYSSKGDLLSLYRGRHCEKEWNRR